jgi:hypothetical protein
MPSFCFAFYETYLSTEQTQEVGSWLRREGKEGDPVQLWLLARIRHPEWVLTCLAPMTTVIRTGQCCGSRIGQNRKGQKIQVSVVGQQRQERFRIPAARVFRSPPPSHTHPPPTPITHPFSLTSPGSSKKIDEELHKIARTMKAIKRNE